MVWFCLYEMSRPGTSLERESRKQLPTAGRDGGSEEWLIIQVALWDEDNVLKLDDDGGCIQLCE